MIYSVVQILRSLNNSWITFRTLQQVELQRNKDGALRYSVGNSAVVVCAKIEGVAYALKCYTAPSKRREAIYGDRLLHRELLIPSEDGEQWVDITLERWHEGVTLSEAIKQSATSRDSATFDSLALRFDRFALDLLAEEWAHGDITCDNIIVDAAGSLHLIDFDGCYLPEFSSSLSEELGTEAFQHPTRTISHFDRTIDDYPLALISTALATLRLDPSAFDEFASAEELLFIPKECVAGCSRSLDRSLKLLAKAGEPFAYAVASMLASPTVELPSLYPILRYKVEGVHPAANPCKSFARNELWGYLNEFNREVIPPIFSSAMSFSEGKAAIKIGRYNHYINTQAQVVVNGSKYQALKSFRGGTARALNHAGEWIEIKDNE